jgi:DNA-binding CsgD family transcriptional regulator
MATPDDEMLTVLVARLLKRTALTHGERREVLHIARGLAARDSARVEQLPVEIIRSRRKAIYRKLHLPGAGELVSRLLALSLTMLVRNERP